MVKPLNWVLFDPPETKAISRSMGKRLALTTILAVAPFLNYGRPTYAACVASPSPTYFCSGTSAGESITGVDNADVSTIASPPFVVTTTGVVIDGGGYISFTDHNASSITNTGYGAGLRVVSTGDILGADGAIEVVTNGTITGENGDGIYTYNHGSGDLSITADGIVTGETSEDFVASDGIYARNNGNNLIITTGDQSIITGNDNAIDARNYGSGDLDITVNGQAKSYDYDGIFAKNSTNGHNLYVTIGAGASVDGAGNGIYAQNRGEGNLDITVDGDVTGQGADGIRAYSHYGTGLSITTGAQSVVLGHDNGIDARNFYSEDSDSDLSVTADGIVTGYFNDGIFAKNYGNDLTITTGAESIVRGGGNGIGAYNFGSGNLTVTADGLVGGYSEDGDGIHAFNSEDGQDLTVTTGDTSDVFGGKDGIDATNYGAGFLKITANGHVAGYGVNSNYGDGIKALNLGTDATIITGADSDVFGNKNGIDARNFGNGFLEITANGQVTGEEVAGIFALNVYGGFVNPDTSSYFFGHGTDLTITTGAGSVVTGGLFGIAAFNLGVGELSITANGQVTGENEDGILSYNAAHTDTDITVGATGLVQGNDSAIDATSKFSQIITITNDGLVRNLSAQSSDLAIITAGGATHIDNNGNLIGQVLLDPSVHFDDVLNNVGFWNAANGASDFAFGEDVINNTGTLRAADDPMNLEVTNINGVENFNNDGGLISLVDGQAGDALFLFPDSFNAHLFYEGTNGHLGVDAELGPAGISDEVHIDGDTSGTTLVHVNVVSATGANFIGIPVVVVTNGTTAEDNFNLDGPLNAGFYSWDMRLNGNQHELFTTGVGVGAFEFPAGITGAQDLWYQSWGTLLQRQADLRALLAGSQVTPVADFAEPVEPTPTAHITPGFWLRGVGAWLKRDDEQNGFNLDREQTIWGGMAGFDFGSESAGEAWMFGLFGGYLSSKLKFDETNSEWKYDGPTVGAYATYMNQAFYANASVKADFLDIDIDPKDLGGENANTDGVNIGGLLDTGYKFGHELFLEPQATLAVVHTEIDDVDVFGGTVKFDDETSVRGRLGLRLGVDHTGSDQMVYTSDVIASVWEDFSGDNKVSITDPSFGSFGASDDPGATYGDVSLGFSVAAPDGWSSFIRGNYQFGDQFEAFAGNAGVRLAW